MSEIKVNSIKGVGASAAAVTVHNSDGTCTLASGSKLNNCTTDGTTNLTIADGNLVIGTGGHGIDFSATAGGINSSTDSSELFQDYEEGGWTPAYTGYTFANSAGYYTRVGNIIHYFLHTQVTNTPNNADYFRIGGLPYTSSNNNHNYGWHSQVLYTDNVNNTGIANVRALVEKNNSFIYFHFVGTGDNNRPASSFFHSTILSKNIIIAGTYQAA